MRPVSKSNSSSQIALSILLKEWASNEKQQEKKPMNGKFKRATMRQVLNEPEGFLDKLMTAVNNNDYIKDNLRDYIENMPQEPSKPEQA